jgi:hypothetical protein
MTLTHPVTLCALLIAMSFAPVLLVVLLGRIPRRTVDHGDIEIGNPILLDDDRSINEPPVTTPLIHLTRLLEESRLSDMILGLRFLPIEKTSPILKRYLHSPDAELQLYAQSIMQDGQEKLQVRFATTQQLALPESPANTASFIGAGLRLLGSPLTPDSEHPAIINKLVGHVESILNSEATHPRLVFETGRFCVRTDRLEDAARMLARLPKESPMHETLQRLLDHRQNILAPQPPLAFRYEIH